jgi:quinol monooxygenase YgiN
VADVVRVVAVLRARPGQGSTVLGLWPELSRQVHAEDGCLAYDLHRVAGDEDRFVVLERWASVEALAAHGRSPHMRQFGAAAADLLAAPPDVMVVEDAPAA